MKKRGMWKMISYNFDNDFGEDVIGIENKIVNEETHPNKDYISYSFDKWMNGIIFHVDILVLQKLR